MSKTVKKTAARKPAAKKAAKAATRRPVAADDAKIVVLAKENPTRPGTEQAKRMAVLLKHKGKSVEDFLSAGGYRTTLRYAVDQQWVRLA